MGFKGLFLRGEWNETRQWRFGNLNNEWLRKLNYNPVFRHYPLWRHFQELLFIGKLPISKGLIAEALRQAQTNFNTLTNKYNIWIKREQLLINYKFYCRWEARLGFTVNPSNQICSQYRMDARFYDNTGKPLTVFFTLILVYIYIFLFKTALTQPLSWF